MKFATISTLIAVIAFSLVMVQSSQALNQGDILLAFTFDEGTPGEEASGMITDITGTGHDAEIRGTPIWTEGVWGAAFEASPGEEFWNTATVRNAPDMELPDSGYTLSAWVRLDAGLIGDCCNMVISKENWGADRTRNYSMWIRPTVTTGYTIGTPPDFNDFGDIEAGHAANLGGEVDDGEWHHLCASWMGPGGSLTQYVDGVATGGFRETTPDLPALTRNSDLHLGAMGPAGEALGIWGSIDDVVVLKVGSTQDECVALMDNGIAGEFPGLAGGTSVDPQGKAATTWAKVKQR